jgi:hypothetical protein
MADDTDMATRDAQPGKAAPTRKVDEVKRDIESERVALDKAFAELQRDLGDALDDLQRRAKAVGRKALVIGPAAGAVAGGLATGALFLRRRRRRGGE